MRHLALILALLLGVYFTWYYLNNKEKVLATIFMKRHTFAVAAIVIGSIFFFAFQFYNHSTRIF